MVYCYPQIQRQIIFTRTNWIKNLTTQILYLDWSGACTGVYIQQNSPNCTLTMSTLLHLCFFPVLPAWWLGLIVTHPQPCKPPPRDEGATCWEEAEPLKNRFEGWNIHLQLLGDKETNSFNVFFSLLKISSNFFYKFYWEIIDMHHCISLRKTDDGLIYIYCEMVTIIGAASIHLLIKIQ